MSHSTSNNAADNWYYSLNGEVQGPVSTQRLTELIDLGILNKDCAICKGSVGNWRYLAEFQGSPESESTQSAAQSAIDRMRTARPGVRTSRTSPGHRTTARSRQFLAMICLAPVIAVGDLLMSLLARVTRRTWTAIGVGVVFASVLLSTSMWYYNSTKEDRAVEQIRAVWMEYQQFRDAAEVPETDWLVFREEALASLGAASRILKTTRGSQQHTDALRMSRDVLPSLIESWPDEDEADLRQCMFLHESRVGPKESTVDEMPSWVMAIVCLDVLLLLVGCWWFLIRRGKVLIPS